MASVLLLGCPEDYAASLPQSTRAVAASDFAEKRAWGKPDLVVIGPASAEASVLAQRVGRAFPGVDVLIAAPRSQVARLKDLLRISPYVPLRTDLVSSEPNELVGQAIREAVARCELRRGHRAVLDSVRHALAVKPSAAPPAAAGLKSAEVAARVEQRRMDSFFRFYGRVRRDVLQDVARATPGVSTAAPVLRAGSGANGAEGALEMEQIERAAALEGAWEPYFAALHATGRAHAELGLGFGPWLEVAHHFRREVVGHYTQQGPTAHDPFVDVLFGMEDFLRLTLREIERAHAEAHRALLERLEANARLFAAAVEASDAAILTASLDGTITAYNAAAERLLGCRGGEALGCALAELAKADLREELSARLAAAAQDSPPSGFESIWCDQQGREVPVSLTISPVKQLEAGVVGLSIVAQDVTKQKQTEESLRQTQKMEAVGRLAGGVAHDFNNLLTVIMAHASLMSAEPGLTSEQTESLSEILQASERARALTLQLLSFSRGQPVEPTRIDVNDTVRSTHRLLRRTFTEQIEITVLCKEELWPVWMDRSQFDQLLMNMALNARDAMPEGGKLRIELENEQLAEPLGALPAGDYVRLRVSDTGFGMAPHVLSHIFEPFFTTKPMGKGTGVGLATCHAIARRAGGNIQVVSEPDRGTTFTIRLPRAAQPERPTAPSVNPSDISTLTGSETILIVEDDPAVRMAAVLALERQGYCVLQAHNGDEARRLVEREPRIALVLTDVVMPQLSGPELAAHLAETHPDLPVLFMSGYAEDSILRRENFPRAAIISKPFM
ncbi:MAG TPA: ATP-binding protein, partial [Polyangiaceae bacterium]|nr:ATP-binding protein [Polyangiaceae bacterium]